MDFHKATVEMKDGLGLKIRLVNLSNLTDFHTALLVRQVWLGLNIRLENLSTLIDFHKAPLEGEDLL